MIMDLRIRIWILPTHDNRFLLTSKEKIEQKETAELELAAIPAGRQIRGAPINLGRV